MPVDGSAVGTLCFVSINPSFRTYLPPSARADRQAPLLMFRCAPARRVFPAHLITYLPSYRSIRVRQIIVFGGRFFAWPTLSCFAPLSGSVWKPLFWRRGERRRAKILPVPQEPHARARGRRLCWKPLTPASDHTLKLPVSPQLLAARCGMTTGGGGCSALCSQKGARGGAQLISSPDQASNGYL